MAWKKTLFLKLIVRPTMCMAHNVGLKREPTNENMKMGGGVLTFEE